MNRMLPSENIAKEFHETYERLAPEYNYDTRKESAVPWEKVPETNKRLMLAVVRDLLSRGVMHVPSGNNETLLRLDRCEEAINTMAHWLVQAQTGFGAQDAEGIRKILRGEQGGT
jgi:hypothetical protein